jgi:hypothetical protein
VSTIASTRYTLGCESQLVVPKGAREITAVEPCVL